MKKGVYLSIIIVFCFYGVFIQPTAAEEIFAAAGPGPRTIFIQKNSITGFVFNTARQPVGDVYVELQSDLYTTISRTKTSGFGFYSFRGLSDGRYIVKVLPYGTDYLEQSRSISLISVSAVPGRGATSEQVDFYLQVKKTDSGPLAAPGVVFAQEIPEKAQKHYEEGVNYLSDKKENEGFESLKKALEIFPDYFLALDRLGTEYVVRGYYRPAYILLTKATQINPKSFSSRFGLGLTLYRLQQLETAIDNLQKAVEIYKDSPEAYLWLGIARLQNGNLPQAKIALNEANKLSKGKSPDVHWQLARLYNEEGKYSEAADELELFLKYHPEAKDKEKIRQSIETLRQKAGAK